eukprot:72754-Alexandrium_andersonii.AAC.1
MDLWRHAEKHGRAHACARTCATLTNSLEGHANAEGATHQPSVWPSLASSRHALLATSVSHHNSHCLYRPSTASRSHRDHNNGLVSPTAI